MIDHRRINILSNFPMKGGVVVYWMQRDQRVHDNWALIYTQQKAIENNTRFIVLFNLVPDFLEATIRQYGFMLKGLKQVELELRKYNIEFVLTFGNPVNEIPKFLNSIKASLLVTDFNPLKIINEWKSAIANKINIPFHEIDAHNIIPCYIASNKQEFAAYTFRPKVNKLLNEFLVEFPSVKKMENKIPAGKIAWDNIHEKLKINFDVKEVDWLLPGEKHADKMLQNFIDIVLHRYGEERNNPTLNAQSNLSPYFHFGQIAPQRVALAVQHLTGNPESQNSFLEELIVRRELADNFCFYNKDYDSFDGFHNWAKESLNLHRKDSREFVYNLDVFENALTHDELWNAAQREMVYIGKMHGYMRMYWAKKILEWSESPEEALRIAIYLNDKYELDGRDPNGYTGIAWSIGGVHDRPWFERKVFGKIRYMNYNGCAKKFDVKKYINNNSRDK